MYVSITGITDSNHLAKYNDFSVEADAVAHASEYNGFALENPGGNKLYWVIDTAAQTITQDTAAEAADTAHKNILQSIQELESLVTVVRYREAASDEAGGTEAGRAWLADISSQINILRGQLV